MTIKDQIRFVLRQPSCWFGLAVQLSSAVVFLTLSAAIRFRWIDIIDLGFENGIDGPTPRLDAIMWTLKTAMLLFAGGFLFHAVAFNQIKRNKTDTTTASTATNEPAAGGSI